MTREQVSLHTFLASNFLLVCWLSFMSSWNLYVSSRHDNNLVVVRAVLCVYDMRWSNKNITCRKQVQIVLSFNDNNKRLTHEGCTFSSNKSSSWSSLWLKNFLFNRVVSNCINRMMAHQSRCFFMWRSWCCVLVKDYNNMDPRLFKLVCREQTWF